MFVWEHVCSRTCLSIAWVILHVLLVPPRKCDCWVLLRNQIWLPYLRAWLYFSLRVSLFLISQRLHSSWIFRESFVNLSFFKAVTSSKNGRKGRWKKHKVPKYPKYSKTRLASLVKTDINFANVVRGDDFKVRPGRVNCSTQGLRNRTLIGHERVYSWFLILPGSECIFTEITEYIYFSLHWPQLNFNIKVT